MENSASDHSYETPESFTFFHISDASYNSDYGIYNSTGQLLKGNKLFEQYTELAMQLDTKRSAFYLESRENEIIFGCSLSVKPDNGREERIVFIQVYKNLPLRYEIGSDIQLLKQFYERVKFEVETADVKKYNLVGLWDEGDFITINETPIDNNVLEYTAGKIFAGKKVSVRISELSSGLSLILKLINRSGCILPFTFNISQHPSESDVSISLIKPDPDFEIRANGTCQELIQPQLWAFYKEMGEEFFKGKKYFEERKSRQDSLNPIVKKILSDPARYSAFSNPIFDNYDDAEKAKIFQGLVLNAGNINDPGIQKILINIYRKTESTEAKRNLQKIFISKKIYIEELIKDLVIDICSRHNIESFNLLFSNGSLESFPAKSPDYEWLQKKSRRGSRSNSFEKGIKRELEDLKYSDKIDFVKFIASKASPKMKQEGRILLEDLIEDLVKLKGNNDFVLKLSDDEAENLDKILDRNFLSTKRRLKKRKRYGKVKRVFFASALVLIILISCLFISIHSTGSEGENNFFDTGIKYVSAQFEYLGAILFGNSTENSSDYTVIYEDIKKEDEITENNGTDAEKNGTGTENIEANHTG